MNGIIDIGTNSVLLLIAEVTPAGEVRVLEDRMTITRLGEGIAHSPHLIEPAIERTMAALRDDLLLCKERGTTAVAAFGTEVLRRAQNRSALIDRAREELGLSIEVLSSDDEAAFAFASIARDMGSNYVVVDIGGGSTEFVTRIKNTLQKVSLPVGAVELTERFYRNDPPSDEDRQALRIETHALVESAIDPEIFSRPNDRELVATGGTATTLMAMHLGLPVFDAARVHGSSLTIGDLRGHIDRLKGLPLEARKAFPGLDPKRADVILAGMEWLHTIMSVLGYWKVTVSSHGVRWGFLYERFPR